MYPRAKAFGLAIHHGRLLVQEYHSADETYYRPLGGSIELGEKSAHTVIREFREELHTEVEITNYVGCLENIFHLNEEIGHEIIQLYSLRLLDVSLYETETLNIQDEQTVSYAKWIPITAFIQKEKVLYPDGILNYIQKKKDEIL
ncbi:NUDIX domain-containing protein [Bacillus sp. AFS094611]|uniref:DNA mismatch repair protein MutT n=1 Tax=Bacillus thuringiensis serovar sooncheon TaxID=180891 RepID=A0A9Q5SEH7_BACTU|nr:MULTISPECIES: NUDIX hydrolase [Bacillus]OTW66529.1 DNA mismatch repair protein MutT [Bacillus thuringiensis serovar coreanensis]OTX43192.1 DNA mismatch repair protein MutT [Bacillus thuringiensis serovar sooncheon]OTX51498.1 DNA mismatch repair protein MutT [Bacillus thuringiensis serovar guiyangiensis]OTX70692.1 DNA mismatch repair protein MutT [Bacillus thuringiensis serovar roskildiensis]PDZ53208.1 NUDIX domain-containing protein [Bacillus sp. AFS094611]